MTTTETAKSSAGPAAWLPVLLATLLAALLGYASPALADGAAPAAGSVGSSPVLVPEPATLVFVLSAALGLFRRRSWRRDD